MENKAFKRDVTDKARNSSVTSENGLPVSHGDRTHFKSDITYSPNSNDGALLLGKNGASGNTYTTRYKIDRHTQRHALCEEVLQEACCPCCMTSASDAWWQPVWAFMRSEAFLITLHMLALSLGVVKEALRLKEIDEKLHLIHSVIETFVALFQVSLRMSAVVSRYREITESVIKVERVDNVSSRDIKGRKLRNWLIGYLVTGIFLILLGISCFLAFYFLLHLGWTLLSNNFILIVTTVSSNLFIDRLNKIIERILEDQHKVVIYEMLLLLREAYQARTKNEREEYFEKVNRFTKALTDTTIFQQPEHIKLADEYKIHWGGITAMELQSFV